MKLQDFVLDFIKEPKQPDRQVDQRQTTVITPYQRNDDGDRTPIIVGITVYKGIAHDDDEAIPVENIVVYAASMTTANSAKKAMMSPKLVYEYAGQKLYIQYSSEPIKNVCITAMVKKKKNDPDDVVESLIEKIKAAPFTMSKKDVTVMIRNLKVSDREYIMRRILERGVVIRKQNRGGRGPYVNLYGMAE